MGFSFILASAMAGYIANGRDIVVVAIIGFSLLVLSMIVCWAYKVLEGLPRNFTNVVFLIPRIWDQRAVVINAAAFFIVS